MANQIKNKEELETAYKTLLSQYNYSGEILNILANLLAECSYLTTLNTSSVLREGSLLTATQLDSMLALAHDNQCPVSRGYCQRLHINDLYVTQNRTVKAFDLMESKSANYKLYFSEDASYDTSGGLVYLTLLVGSDLVVYENTDVVDNRLSSTTHILEIPDEGLSEDFLLFKNEEQIYNVDEIALKDQTDAKYQGMMYTTNARLLSESIPYYIATCPPNFSVKIYNYSKFKKDDKYTFKCVKKVKSNVPDISTNIINSLQGFIYKGNSPSITSTASIDAENSISFLKTKIIANFRDRSYISSYNAITNAISSKLAEYFLGYTINIVEGQFLVTYALKDGANFTTAMMNSVKQELVFDYRIEEELVFKQAKDKKVPLYLNIYYDSVIDELAITAIIDDYQKKVGGEYTVDALKSYISKQENISYVEYIPEYADLMRDQGENVSLEVEEPKLDDYGSYVDNEDGSHVMETVIYRLRFSPREIRYIPHGSSI